MPASPTTLPPLAMNAILLTVFVGFILVNFFILLFLRYRSQAQASSPERDSLLPFEEEAARPARASLLPATALETPDARPSPLAH